MPPLSRTRLGVFGGTFDPIHVGHVVLAADLRRQLRLDRVLLVVAAVPWQKEGEVVASAADRLAVVEAVVAEVEGLEACAIEVSRQGPSYMVDTLSQLAEEHPDSSLHLLVGADAAAGIDSWDRAELLPGLANLAVATRGGRAPGRVPVFLSHETVDIPAIDISSTEIRERLRRGWPIDGLVPAAGVRLIRERGLYPGPG